MFYNAFTVRFTTACNAIGFCITLFVSLIKRAKDVFVRWGLIRSQLNRFIWGGLPLVVVTSFFSGLILAFQTGVQLEKFNQEALIGYIVSVSMCKEMGPVFTAIALTGLIGAAISAEIASMKVQEEIDALEVMAINPTSYLILPRCMALLITLPLMTVIADAVGIVTGAIISNVRFQVPYYKYFDNTIDVLKLSDIYGGLLKAVFFGLLIGIISTGNGLRAKYGAEGVGNATLHTVVYAFLFVLLFDHLLNYFVYY